MARATDRLLKHPPFIDDLVGLVPEVVRHDPQMRALPRLDLVLVVPDGLRFTGPELPLVDSHAIGFEPSILGPPDDRVDVARRPFRLPRPLDLGELDRVEPLTHLGGRLTRRDPFKDLPDDQGLLGIDLVVERPLGGLGLRRRHGTPALVADDRVAHRGPAGP